MELCHQRPRNYLPGHIINPLGILSEQQMDYIKHREVTDEDLEYLSTLWSRMQKMFTKVNISAWNQPLQNRDFIR